MEEGLEYVVRAVRGWRISILDLVGKHTVRSNDGRACVWVAIRKGVYILRFLHGPFGGASRLAAELGAAVAFGMGIVAVIGQGRLIGLHFPLQPMLPVHLEVYIMQYSYYICKSSGLESILACASRESLSSTL